MLQEHKFLFCKNQVLLLHASNATRFASNIVADRIAKFPFYKNGFHVLQGYSCIICILLFWRFTTCLELCFTSGATRSPPFKLFNYANNYFFLIQKFKPLRKFKRDFLKAQYPDETLQHLFFLTFSICIERQFCFLKVKKRYILFPQNWKGQK